MAMGAHGDSSVRFWPVGVWSLLWEMSTCGANCLRDRYVTTIDYPPTALVSVARQTRSFPSHQFLWRDHEAVILFSKEIDEHVENICPNVPRWPS